MSDVIIIGAGVIGTSIAYNLAKKGCTDVTVLEKNTIGSGATEKCAGGIRQQFSMAANISLSMESEQFFAHFQNETGHPADFRQSGYLLLATTLSELDVFQRNIILQRTLGLEVDFLSPGEVKELVPGLNVDDVRGATFCRTDGYADPYSVVSGFASAARRYGVKIIEQTEVTGIEAQSKQTKIVSTTAGIFTAPIVVNAAGVDAGKIGKMVGLTIPVHPKRRHIMITEPISNNTLAISEHRANLPMVVDFHNGFWIRPEGLCFLFGMRNPDEMDGFDTSVDWNFFINNIAPAACHRLPEMLNIGIMRAQAGLHPDTEDGMAILGKAPDIDGLYLACGLCGHGFMHAPAVGRLMAELIMGEIASLPYGELFNLNRFQHYPPCNEDITI